MRKAPGRALLLATAAGVLVTAAVLLLDRRFPPPLEALVRPPAVAVLDADGRPLRLFLPADERWRLPVSLDELPPELAQSITGPEQRQEFLRKYVADELLWRKAQKLEYDRDDEVLRRHAALLKQLAVTAFVEQEVVRKIEVDEEDLELAEAPDDREVGLRLDAERVEKDRAQTGAARAEDVDVAEVAHVDRAVGALPELLERDLEDARVGLPGIHLGGDVGEIQKGQ